MIAVIDNYDSFTYNLVHYLEAFDVSVDVFRNDELAIKDLEKYSHILLSPGPGLPNEVPLLKEVFSYYSGKKNILGICLGMQAMVEAYDGVLYNLKNVLHGHQGECIKIKDDPLLNAIPSAFKIGHYHSWGVNEEGMPKDLEIIARDSEDRIMIVKHASHKTYGIQFHPESVLSPHGKKIIQNWLKIT